MSFFEMGIVEVNGETAAGRRGEKLNLKLDDIYTMSIGITRKDYQLAIFDLSGNMIKTQLLQFSKENGFREIVENPKADAVKMANEYGNNRILESVWQCLDCLSTDRRRMKKSSWFPNSKS